jgi:hypothetical protein
MMRKILEDLRIGGNPRYYVGHPAERLMLIDDEIRKCVAFVGCTTPDGFKLAGTMFFVGAILEAGKLAVYAVTAKHVIVAADREASDKKIKLKVNARQGEPKIVDTKLGDWRFHTDPYVDVAVLSFFDPDGLDFLAFPSTSFATETVIQKESIGIGEEVFLVGLFSEHAGRKKNTPIVRVGNIAAMPEEQIETTISETIVNIDAYLVECKSIGGLSGSPVFVHLGVARNQAGQLVIPASQRGTSYLLGLMHGHWEFPRPQSDSLKLDETGGDSVNVGIAIVIPAQKIIDVLARPELVEERNEMLREIKGQRAPRLDSEK